LTRREPSKAGKEAYVATVLTNKHCSICTCRILVRASKYCLTSGIPDCVEYAVNLATLPDIVLDNVVDKLDAISDRKDKSAQVALSYTSKRLNQFANRSVYRHIRHSQAANPLLRQSLLANPINLRYIQVLDCQDVDDLARLWSLPPMTRLKEITFYKPKDCSLSSITACLAARHVDFTMPGLLSIHDMEYWDFLIPAFSDLVEVRIGFRDISIRDRPSAQKVVDSLQCLSLRKISMTSVSDWQLDLGERFPKLEVLDVHADCTLVFNDACWHRITALMDRSIYYSCMVRDDLNTRPLYQAVLAYAELNGLEPAPMTRWLATGDIKAGRSVDFDKLESHHLLKVLRSIESIDGDLRLKVTLYAEYINEILSLIPRSVTYLILTTRLAARFPPDKFLDFFLPLPKLGALEVFDQGDPGPFTGEIWPAGHLTHASVPFVGTHEPRAGMRVVAFCHKTGRLTGELYSKLEPESIDPSCADFGLLNEEIISWFGMKPSLRYVCLWRNVTAV
jgi:hypothetical protein